MTIEDQFQEFHRANPHVMQLIVNYTCQLKAKGRTHYSIKTVFERIRWHLDVETISEDGFKLNNNYTSRYVRLLEELFPEHRGFYRTRELRAA